MAETKAAPGHDLWIRPVLFALFFLSGFCSLVYQIIWLRMAFAHFGVITPVLSTVISVFMLGLGIGSLLAGRYGGALCTRLGCSAATLYGATEMLIGLGAFVVPWSMAFGQHLLLDGDAGGSASYLALSSVAIAVSILPWCVLMGATLPLMMGFVGTGWRDPDRDVGKTRSFSFLYRANVIGAATGTLLCAGVLIEWLGFTGTGLVAALTNLLIGAIGIRLGAGEDRLPACPPAWGAPTRPAVMVAPGPVPANLILFTTGFCSLAMEVVWTRGFTIVLKTTIYAFAAILATYLLATAIGAALYRRRVRLGSIPSDTSLLLAACFTACVPAILDDPRIQMTPLDVLLSIVPFSVVLGILTPRLVDAASLGDPARAATSYTMNILGSILGPLVAGYLLVTRFDVRICLLLLVLPLIALATWSVLDPRLPAAAPRPRARPSGTRTRTQRVALAGCVGVLALSFAFARSYESSVSGGEPFETRRDYAATAIAFGAGQQKTLLVNGVGITSLTPITKIMADLPLAVHGHARNGLVICFGMGTTMRTMSRWGIDTTAVDLTASVIRLFGFFHADAASVTAARNVHMVVDDGRRYLTRVGQTYDVIVIDPPPPIEAAGSSLLYSREMYTVIRRRLRPGGILQQWYPGDDDATGQAVARTLSQAFAYVVAYRSIEGWGTHYLASMQPIPTIDAATFVSRLPEPVRRDLVEWDPRATPLAMATRILAGRVPVSGGDRGPIITDDHPYNEYYLARSLLGALRGQD
ncbi:hypothetical protein [Lichenicoccus sp.]|uniref:spermine/spermidine synthase domain-containing protein n=1 Tax=Lichenicoccus sp. TaxID=2781899 RepID=UPI003D0F11BD